MQQENYEDGGLTILSLRDYINSKIRITNVALICSEAFEP